MMKYHAGVDIPSVIIGLTVAWFIALGFYLSGCTSTSPAVVRTPYIEQVPDERQGVICYRDRDSGSISCVQVRDSKQPP